MVKIDIVIPWVDGSDPDWIKEKCKYAAKTNPVDVNRYRDWDNLRYLFRGIEKFAPWVNNIFFVTCGQKPDWLNENCCRLKLVNHTDYIPKEYLPTFSSHPIELNFHRIEGLSEYFIYLNDDMFFTNTVSLDDFLQAGKTCAMLALDIVYPSYDYKFYNILRNNLTVLNRNFPNIDIKKHIFKLRYGKNCIKSLCLYNWNCNQLEGLYIPHIPVLHCKTTFEEGWKKEGTLLDEVCHHKFRDERDVNQYIMYYWQILSDNYVPYNFEKYSCYFNICKDVEKASRAIENQKFKFICLNDDLKDNNLTQYETVRDRINKSFEKILPEKSQFEK